MNYVIEATNGFEQAELLLESILEDKTKEVILFQEITSQEVRDLIEYDMVDNRVFIIYDLDNRVKEQNMLLKTLEESNNIFIIVVERYNNLLETVRSRCVLAKSNKPEKLDVTEEVEDLIYKVVNHIGQASTANLFVLIEKVEQLDCKEQYVQFLSQLITQYGEDPQKHREHLKIVGGAKRKIKIAPSMRKEIFTVALLDLRELANG